MDMHHDAWWSASHACYSNRHVSLQGIACLTINSYACMHNVITCIPCSTNLFILLVMDLDNVPSTWLHWSFTSSQPDLLFIFTGQRETLIKIDRCYPKDLWFKTLRSLRHRGTPAKIDRCRMWYTYIALSVVFEWENGSIHNELYFFILFYFF